ncbi:MAG TPA: hypothetical protein DEP84_22600 [Chloroflexi bacterium]|nr:hypothetical protein [Chloroflexota bacterium]
MWSNTSGLGDSSPPTRPGRTSRGRDGQMGHDHNGDRRTEDPLTPMRAAIAAHMIHSKQTSAHVTAVLEVDMSRVVAFRRTHTPMPFCAMEPERRS